MDLLPLDGKIRDWVLIPIFVSSILVSLGRTYASKLLTPAPDVGGDAKRRAKQQRGDGAKGGGGGFDFETFRAKQILMRSTRLRSEGNILLPSRFEARKALFVAKKGGLLRIKKTDAPPPNPLQDPAQMNATMKQSFTGMVPQMAMMGFVNYFFTGFVLCKVPFPLTSGFREMLQRGVVLTTLDVSYVSSLSVYFLAMFGLSGFFWLLLNGPSSYAAGASGEGGAGGMEDPAAQMGLVNPMAQQQANQPFDAVKAFESERDSLELFHHEFKIADAEKRFLSA